MDTSTHFILSRPDSTKLVGNHLKGEGRQILFITGFLSKRWGNKSKALADICRKENWGFCCFDFRGNGDSEGNFTDYTLQDWLDDARSVATMLTDGPPLTIIGSSLGGWLAWMLGQELRHVHQLLLLAPAFNMMGKRAQDISSARRQEWQEKGWMPWSDDALHRDFPIAWKWVEESERLWTRRFENLHPVPTTILHGLQDDVIPPSGSWEMTQNLLSVEPHFPIELILKIGDHRFSSASNLQTFLDLASHIAQSPT